MLLQNARGAVLGVASVLASLGCSGTSTTPAGSGPTAPGRDAGGLRLDAAGLGGSTSGGGSGGACNCPPVMCAAGSYVVSVPGRCCSECAPCRVVSCPAVSACPGGEQPVTPPGACCPKCASAGSGGAGGGGASGAGAAADAALDGSDAARAGCDAGSCRSHAP